MSVLASTVQAIRNDQNSRNRPKAQIVYDRYHLMVMAGEAVDELRRQLQRQGAQLKGALWSLRGNPWNLDAEQQQTRARLAQQYKPLGRTLALRAALQDLYDASSNDGPELLRCWCLWAARSRLAPSASSLKPSDNTGKVSSVTSNAGSPREPSKQSTASSNPLNAVLAASVTSPFLRPIAYLVAAKLKIPLPSILPT